VGRGVLVAPLYGDLSQEEQERAIAPSPPGWRKVVLATSIAETSLTIEGVGVVIDSGLMRVPRFSPRTGLSRLETVPVTRASSDQRRGRAGRLGPGVCYRVWSETEQAGLVPHRAPEILEADLAPLALELAAWGVADPHELAWLDAPPAAAFAQAAELLAELGALHGGGVTAHGRRMARLPAHPRIAHMLILARRLDRAQLACDLTALLGERDVLRRTETPADPDIRPRLDALRRARQHGIGAVHTVAGRQVDRGVLHRILREADHWRRRLGLATARTSEPSDGTDAGLLLAFAFPDRIARRRPGGRGRFLLRSGRGAAMMQDTALAGEDFIVAAEVDARGAEGRVFLAAPLTRAELDTHFAAALVMDDDVSWDAGARRVRALRRLRLGAIVLEEKPARDVDADRLRAALLAGVAREGIGSLPWSDEARRLQQRVSFLRRLEPDTWPDLTDAKLGATLAAWLGPHVSGCTSIEELSRLDMARVLGGLVPPAARPALDVQAPTHLVVPSGSRIPIDYTDPDSPAVAVRLQEVFGLRETPRIGGGRVPLTFRLLSPAQRPVQVTRDLASFWRSGYFEVRKDLKGRYPKHDWPLDPLTAAPTRRARPRR
jgi:ATP-dependent helicase HrpB